METAAERYYKVRQVMQILGISRGQVNYYRKRGILKSTQFMPGGDHRYFKEDVNKLLNAR